ncbi:hypothetical protein HZH66_003936 [Vespula vulgaris]|uniref:Uncharacterized protein n=1 Tax=Vespula vulgaris TaxID=7454 RepID=A0A834NCI4_VESVU|nr:hypothetical protein HZH66_003936 [Vespula vulgaris]
MQHLDDVVIKPLTIQWTVCLSTWSGRVLSSARMYYAYLVPREAGGDDGGSGMDCRNSRNLCETRGDEKRVEKEEEEEEEEKEVVEKRNAVVTQESGIFSQTRRLEQTPLRLSIKPTL